MRKFVDASGRNQLHIPRIPTDQLTRHQALRTQPTRLHVQAELLKVSAFRNKQIDVMFRPGSHWPDPPTPSHPDPARSGELYCAAVKRSRFKSSRARTPPAIWLYLLYLAWLYELVRESLQESWLLIRHLQSYNRCTILLILRG